MKVLPLLGQTPEGVDSLMTIIQSKANKSIRLNATIEMAEWWSGRDLKQSNNFYHQAIRLISNPGNDPIAGQVFAKLAVNFTRMAIHDSSNYYINKATVLNEKFPKNGDLAVLYYLCQSVKKKMENKLIESIPFGIAATGHQENKHQRRWAAHALLALGSSFSMMGDFEHALTYNNRSLELFKQENDELGISYAVFQIANLLHHEKDYTNAEKYYLKALAIQKRLGVSRGLANTYGFLASLYRQTGQLNKAQEKIDSAIVLSARLGQETIHTGNLVSKASILIERKEFIQAGQLLEEALNRSVLAKNISQAAFVTSEKARLALKLDNMPLAINLIRESITQAEAAISFDSKIAAYGLAAEIFERSGNFQAALQASKRWNQMQDSATAAKAVERLKMMEIQQTLNLREKELALLTFEQQLNEVELKKQRVIQFGIGLVLLSVIVSSILIINRQRSLAKAKRNLELEKMRNRIARDLHDDLGSSLSAIKVLSQTGITNTNQTQSNLTKIRDKASTLLDSMSDMVWSVNADNDTFSQMLSRMREYASETLDSKGINYTFDFKAPEQLVLSLDQRRNLYLIFKEAVNNAAKYSQAKNLSIAIEANHQLSIKIRDDGVGFNIKSVKPGNGLGNFEKRATEMGGKLVIDSAPGQGTCLELTAPLT